VDFGILLLILFILAPLLEKLLKAGRPKEPPEEQQQPRPRMQQRSLPGEERTRAGADDETAAGVLPDDLWEILTGERRPPREPDVPRPEPRPEPVARPEPRPAPRAERPTPARERELERVRVGRQVPDRAAAGRPARAEPPSRERRLPSVEMGRQRPAPGGMVRRERSSGPPPSDADRLVRKVPVHEAPAIVSLESPIESGEIRRARFQKRLAQMSDPALVTSGADPKVMLFGSRAELRRAIVAAEVLGRPRGLE
jgi:hypothetical protein